MLLGFGGYLPERVVTNEELVDELSRDHRRVRLPGHRHPPAPLGRRRTRSPRTWPTRRRWRRFASSGIAAKDIDAVIVATTTPDVAMPSTAAILQDRLNLQTIPAFDLNAACSGWLYAVSMAQGMILSGTAHNVLTVGVDMQSRLLDKSDRSAYFLFGDGAGAAIVSSGGVGPSHPPGDPRLRHPRPAHGPPRGAGLRRSATATATSTPGFASTATPCSASPPRASPTIIRQAMAKSGWSVDETRWIIPHQANGRILKAAAKRSGVGFDRFFLNVEHVGNTSSASIPLAIDRGRREPPAGRQAGALLGRRRHDHRGDFGRVVGGRLLSRLAGADTYCRVDFRPPPPRTMARPSPNGVYHE